MPLVGTTYTWLSDFLRSRRSGYADAATLDSSSRPAQPCWAAAAYWRISGICAYRYLPGQAVDAASRWPLMPWKYLLPTHCCGEAASTPCRLSFQAKSTP